MIVARKKQPPRLVSHRTVADWLDIDPSTLREWVTLGEFPEPHSIIRQTWFYPAAAIEHYLKTGRWPEDVRFRRVSQSPATAGA